jgi:hydroxyethylthiazole kinase-like uncharacterized protein yjeF
VLGAWKHAHFAMPSAPLMGTLRLVDIGVAEMPGAATVLPMAHMRAPAPDDYKYTRGLLAIVGGAMPGAAMLAALAARHAGAGYLRLIAQARIGAVPHDLVVVEDTPTNALADPRIAAVLVGPGLGRDAAARERLQAALATDFPTVIDADALMLLRQGQGGKVPRVLTPHAGEMAALERAYGLGSTGLKRDRTVQLAVATGALVIGKGPDTVIATPAGQVIVAPRASSWLSVAGTGDVLAGIVASRLAVTRDPLRAACEGVWLHGRAAEFAGPGFAAEDLAQAVRSALRASL